MELSESQSPTRSGMDYETDQFFVHGTVAQPDVGHRAKHLEGRRTQRSSSRAYQNHRVAKNSLKEFELVDQDAMDKASLPSQQSTGGLGPMP